MITMAWQNDKTKINAKPTGRCSFLLGKKKPRVIGAFLLPISSKLRNKPENEIEELLYPHLCHLCLARHLLERNLP